MPSDNFVLEAGDYITVIGSPKALSKLLDLVCPDELEKKG